MDVSEVFRRDVQPRIFSYSAIGPLNTSSNLIFPTKYVYNPPKLSRLAIGWISSTCHSFTGDCLSQRGPISNPDTSETIPPCCRQMRPQKSFASPRPPDLFQDLSTWGVKFIYCTRWFVNVSDMFICFCISVGCGINFLCFVFCSKWSVSNNIFLWPLLVGFYPKWLIGIHPPFATITSGNSMKRCALNMQGSISDQWSRNWGVTHSCTGKHMGVKNRIYIQYPIW